MLWWLLGRILTWLLTKYFWYSLMVFRLNVHFSVCLTCKMLKLGKMVFFKFHIDKVEVLHSFAWRKHWSWWLIYRSSIIFSFTFNCCVSSSFNQFPGLSLGCSGHQELSCSLSEKLSSSFCTGDLSWAASASVIPVTGCSFVTLVQLLNEVQYI